MDRLIGAERHSTFETLQRLVLARGQRLFDQLDAEPCEIGDQPDEIVQAKRLVGVDDQPGARGRGANGGHPVQVVRSADLQLQERPAGGVAGRLGHGLRRTEAEGVGGLHRVQPLAPGEPPCAHARALGFQVPERAIERVAGRPGRKRTLQAFTVEPGFHRALNRLDLGRHRCRRLSIAGVGNRLATAAGALGGDLHDNHLGLGLRPAGDDEGRCGRPAFDANLERGGGTAQCRSPTAASSSRKARPESELSSAVSMKPSRSRRAESASRSS